MKDVVVQQDRSDAMAVLLGADGRRGEVVVAMSMGRFGRGGCRGAGLPAAVVHNVSRAWRHAVAVSTPCALAVAALVGVEEGKARQGKELCGGGWEVVRTREAAG